MHQVHRYTNTNNLKVGRNEPGLETATRVVGTIGPGMTQELKQQKEWLEKWGRERNGLKNGARNDPGIETAKRMVGEMGPGMVKKIFC